MFKQYIKSKLKPGSFAFRVLRKLYNAWIPLSISQEDFLNYYGSLKKEVYFIEIGANDGKSNDPIHKNIMKGKWKGLLIEPVESIFKRLKENYKAIENNVTFLNVAISNEEGEATFFSIKESANKDLPEWYDHLGSFSRDVVLKHKHVIPNLEELIEERKVKTVTFASLVKKNYYPTYDLLQVDTEGFDYEILKMIDWSLFKPEVVIYEHRHLSNQDHKESIALLKNMGYSVYLSGGDTMAISKPIATGYTKRKDNVFLKR